MTIAGQDEPEFEPLKDFVRYSESEMTARSSAFLSNLKRRRTIRDYEEGAVPRPVLENCLRTASYAPSGANMQPWHFTVIEDSAVKHRIRVAAEEEEREFYETRAPAEWLKALAPLGTDADKSFLEHATLIAVFAERYGKLPDGTRVKHYYVQESVGIAVGFLIAALHHAGLATLTHTPSPMGFLTDICGRPENEKPYLLLVTGYPSSDCQVPVFGGTRRGMDEVVSWV